MKVKCLAVRVIFSLLFVVVPSVVFADYLGSICLQSIVLARETGPVAEEVFIAQYDVSSLGGNAYSVVGSVGSSNDSFIFSGYGTLIGTELYMNLTTSQNHSDGWKDTGVNQTRLDVATMTGTFYEIGRDFNITTGAWDNRYTSGTVAQISCP